MKKQKEPTQIYNLINQVGCKINGAELTDKQLAKFVGEGWRIQ